MIKGYRKSTGSSTTTVWAQSMTGEWFTRDRFYCPRYGWKWSSWRLSGEPPMEGKIDLDFGGCSYGSLAVPQDQWPKVRLPKVA